MSKNGQSSQHEAAYDRFESEKPREACGVFGVYASNTPTASLTYLGLFALQHRGQESAGIASSNGETITVIKDLGLVSQVFDERRLSPLQGHLTIGHVRYSTTGDNVWENSQPIYREGGACGFALAHNGNITNVRRLMESHNLNLGKATSDTDILAEVIGQEYEEAPDARGLERAIEKKIPQVEGAFSTLVMDDSRLIGVRDPRGFRPLCLGRIEKGWVLASETCALDILDAAFVREIAPGEMIVIDAQGVHSYQIFPPTDPHLCVFEFVYFARPDSQLYGINVYQARSRMGEALATQAAVEADLVMPVPESGVPAAQGFSKRSGIPYGEGLVKNRYVGRTFIAPTQELRDRSIRMKLNPLVENVRGKRLVVVDDSIVRGSTTRRIVALLRASGAKEVHLRISSPPYRWPCYFGMDTGRRGELVAASLSVEEIQQYVGADTLAYLEKDRMLEATSATEQGFCTACLDGNYPLDVSEAIKKDGLEF